MRILIVDDDAMIGMLLGDMLDGMGHDMAPLETTHQGAVAAVVRQRPDLMIVDVGLGADCGIAAMDEVLADGFVPHIFMSGNIRRVEAIRPGTPVLEKPFDWTRLEAAIHMARPTPPRIDGLAGPPRTSAMGGY